MSLQSPKSQVQPVNMHHHQLTSQTTVAKAQEGKQMCTPCSLTRAPLHPNISRAIQLYLGPCPIPAASLTEERKVKLYRTMTAMSSHFLFCFFVFPGADRIFLHQLDKMVSGNPEAYCLANTNIPVNSSKNSLVQGVSPKETIAVMPSNKELSPVLPSFTYPESHSYKIACMKHISVFEAFLMYFL